MNNLQRYLQMGMDWAVIFVPKLLIALLILWIGLRIISKLNLLTNKTLAVRKVDSTIRPFFSSMVDIGLKFILFIVVAGIFGFEISSIIALLGALAFAVGLALQGSLGHFASGILLLRRPFTYVRFKYEIVSKYPFLGNGPLDLRQHYSITKKSRFTLRKAGS